jgi:hypothetical protein
MPYRRLKQMEENTSLYIKMNSAVRTLATSYYRLHYETHQRPLVTICATCFKLLKHRLYLCVSYGSTNKQRGVITLNSINCLVFVAGTMCFL